MKTRHSVVIHSTCPVNGDADVYFCRVYPPDGTVLYCEAIEAAVKEATKSPITQEAITQQLANALNCKIKTTGVHCRGRVASKVVCEPIVAEVVQPCPFGTDRCTKCNDLFMKTGCGKRSRVDADLCEYCYANPDVPCNHSNVTLPDEFTGERHCLDCNATIIRGK